MIRANIILRVVAVISVFILSGVFVSAENTAIATHTLVNGSQTVRHWTVAGPFVVTDENDSATGRYFESIFPVGGLAADTLTRSRSITTEEVVDFRHALESWSVGEGPATACFGAVIVECESAVRVFATLGTDDDFDVWLNGAIACQWRGRRVLRRAENIIPLDLRAGQNLVVVKVFNRNGWTGFSMGLESTLDQAVQKRIEANFRCFLASAVVPDFSALRLDLAGGEYRGSIIGDIYEGPTKIGEVQWPNGEASTPQFSSPLPLSGVYALRARIAGRDFDQSIVVGELTGLATHFVENIREHSKAGDVEKVVEPIERRLRILLEPTNVNPAQLDWQRKITHAFVELSGIDRTLRDNAPFALRQPGLRFYSFRSKIDDQRQYYRIFWPSHADGRVPLFVLMPTPLSANRPFIASTFAAKHIEAERLSAIAEQLGVGFLWIGYRSLPYGAPADFSHFDEVLSDVSGIFPVDEKKIYLLGTCAGGMLGMMTAIHSPDRFAGLGILNGIYRRPSHRYDGSAGFGKLPAYRRWIQKAEPTATALRATGVPVAIVYDGAEPGHGDYSNTEQFLLECKAAGLKVAFETRQQGYAFHVDGWEQLMRKLLGTPRTAAVNRPKSAGSDPRNDTVALALAEPFVVVAPNAESGQSARAALAEGFLAAWKQSNFGPCVTLDENRVSEALNRGINIVLVGNGETDRAWNEVIGSGVAIDRDEIRAFGKRWKGSNLAIQLVTRSRMQPGTKIVVIGAQDPSRASVGTSELSIDGWFQFAVWRSEGAEAELIDAGFFPESAFSRR